jgi:hypothetical protein
MFEHYSNPWSARAQPLSTPIVPFWTRSWEFASLVGVWLLLNPIVFPEPRDDSVWAKRAMVGEKLWLAKRPLN